MQIAIDIDNKQVGKLLQRLQRRGHNLRPVLGEIGEILLTSIERNFAAAGRPHKWPASGRVKRGGGQTLTDTGRLRRSFTRKIGNDQVAIGTNVEYAAALHFGAKVGPHIIKPKHGKALFWPGAAHPVKQVRHPGFTLPARPFLMVQDDDWPKIRRAVERHLTRG